MGYDIVAYFYVIQEQIEEFINENEIDRNDSNQDHLVVDYFKSNNPDIKDLGILYQWDEECKLHEFFDCYRTNFIRDDRRFSNTRFMQNFPYCLHNINHNLHNAEDAIEIADAINTFFAEDNRLLSFADWLITTSKHCFMYELSL